MDDPKNRLFKIVIRGEDGWGHMPQDMPTQPGDEVVLEKLNFDAVMQVMLSRMFSMMDNACDGMCHKCAAGQKAMQESLVDQGRARWPNDHAPEITTPDSTPEQELDATDAFWADVVAAMDNDD